MRSSKKVLIAGIALFASLLVTGCANTGNQAVAKLDDDASVSKVLIAGQTTKEEVLAKFGEPNEMDFADNGNVKFVYKHVRSTIKASSFVPVVGLFKSGTNDTYRHLVIVFNKANVVEKHLFTKSKGETVSGLLG